MYPEMSPEELKAARDMLGYYGLPGGWTPGSFTSALIKLLEVADTQNTARTLSAFPEFRTAYSVMTFDGGEALSQMVAEQSK
jgi:hypothetical protein